MAFATNVFPAPDYIPESFSSDPFNVRSGEGVVELRLLDPPQREQPAFKPSAIEHKRAKTYQDSNVILVMFSIADRSSFDSARSRWADEVKRLAPQVPLLLIGLKTDLRLVSFIDLYQNSYSLGRRRIREQIRGDLPCLSNGGSCLPRVLCQDEGRSQ